MSEKSEPTSVEKKKNVTIFVVVVNSKEELLLVDNKEQYKADRDFTKQRKWGLPGGGVRVDEGDSAAAVREVDEETGLAIRAETINLADWDQKDGGHLVLVVTAQAVDEGAVLRAETEDTWKAAWFPLEGLPYYDMYPCHLGYIEKALKKSRVKSAATVKG